MNAQSLAHGPSTARASARSGMFLGFGTFFRKEITRLGSQPTGARYRCGGDRDSGVHDPHPLRRPVYRSARAASRCRWTRPTTSSSAGPADDGIVSLLASMSLLSGRARSRDACVGLDLAGLADQHPRGEVAGGGRRAHRRHHPHPARRLGRGGDRLLRGPAECRDGRAVRSRVHHSPRLLCQP